MRRKGELEESCFLSSLSLRAGMRTRNKVELGDSYPFMESHT